MFISKYSKIAGPGFRLCYLCHMALFNVMIIFE